MGFSPCILHSAALHWVQLQSCEPHVGSPQLLLLLFPSKGCFLGLFVCFFPPIDSYCSTGTSVVVLVAAHFNKQSLDLQNHHECHLLHPCRKGAADTRTPKGCTQSSSPGSAFPELSAASQIGFPTSKQSLLTQRQGKQQHHPTLHEQFPSRLLTAQQRCEAELGWHSSSCHGCSADISSDCSS